MSTWHFEDIVLGNRHEIGREVLTPETIIAFASQFDWQPFHMDAEKAKDSLFGGLCASGWHVCALWMSKIVPFRAAAIMASSDPAAALAAQGPSPGVKDLRWLRPAFAGDELVFWATSFEKVEWKKPGWGLVRTRAEVTLPDETPVCTFIGQGLVRKKDQSA